MAYSTSKKTAPDGLPAIFSVRGGDFGITGGAIPDVVAGGGRRGDCQGWNSSKTLRCHAFVKSVVESSLSGHGYAITNTLKTCPATPADMHNLLERYWGALKYRGLLRLFWVCEFQPRKKEKTGGVPHFHIAAYFKNEIVPEEINKLWCKFAAEYGAQQQAQMCKKITDIGGWMGYFIKHVDKGIRHYQRQRKTMPPHWQGKTGRVWGKQTAPGVKWDRNNWQLLFSVETLHKVFLLRDCEFKKRLAEARHEICNLTGSHFMFIRNRTGKMSGGEMRFWVWHWCGFESEKFADMQQVRLRGALRGIMSARRAKKRSMPQLAFKSAKGRVFGMREDVAMRILGRVKSKFSPRRGFRGTGRGYKNLVDNIMSPKVRRGYVPSSRQIELRLQDYKFNGAKLQQKNPGWISYFKKETKLWQILSKKS